MARVELKNLSKTFNDTLAVADITISIKDREFLVLVGPSGCGKSTTLRMVAGLEEISSGEIWIDGELVNQVPPKDRDVAMVFQNYALYPHMTVFENMAFGLKLRKYPKSEVNQRVAEAAGILGIENLLNRKPKELSGGEQQRVAVGRAIVRKPKVFLLDEPLSNLDAKLRVQMRGELQKIHSRLQATFIYVTHDQLEAMTMGTRIVVMNKGRIEQVDDPLTVYEKPANMFVAGFVGTPAMNFIYGSFVEARGGIYFDEDNFLVRMPDSLGSILQPLVERGEVVLGLRPEHIEDKMFASSANPDNTVSVSVEIVEPIGPKYEVSCSTGKSLFMAEVSAKSEVQVNQDIELVFNMDKAHVFDPETGKRII